MIVVGAFPMFLSGINVITGACFASGPGTLHKGGRRTVAFVALLTVWQYWVYMYLHHYPRLTGCTEGLGCLGTNPIRVASRLMEEGSEVHIMIYHVCMVLWVWSWVTAICTDVTSKEKTKELVDAYERSAEDGDSVRMAHRAAGCRRCTEIGGASVEGFDHYCPLVANAVGRRNRKAFVLTLIYQMVTGLILLRDGIPVAVEVLSNKSTIWDGQKNMQVLVGVVLSIHINLVCLFLFTVQFLVLPLGISSVELWNFCPWLQDEQVLATQRWPALPRPSTISKELGPFYLCLVPL